MFNIRRAQLQKLQAARPGQLMSAMFEELGFENLLKPSVQAELYEKFDLVFDQYAKAASFPPGGEKVYAFDALRLVEGISDA